MLLFSSANFQRCYINKIYFDFTDAFWVEIKTNKKEDVTENVTENRRQLIEILKN